MNKNQIIDIARKIKTYELSIGEGGCCEVYPRKPETRARLRLIQEQEALLKIRKA